MAFKKLRVAIVGAGPCGLVTASTLLQTGKFEVTIFEKSAEVGGLWAEGGYIDPQMTTNLCKYTVSFSGLSWDSIDVNCGQKSTPMYPKAWQVRRYLQEYCRRYIPEGVIRYESLVTAASLTKSEDLDRAWSVTIMSPEHINARSETFDFLVISSGQFSQPRVPDHIVDTVTQSKLPVKIVHSTDYRVPSDLLSRPQDLTNTPVKLVVVGGSHSGSEAATKLALQLWSSGDLFEKGSYEIVHLTSRTMFAVSPYVQSKSSDVPIFEPTDFKVFNRSAKPPDPDVSFTYSLMDPEKYKETVAMLQSLTGIDQLTYLDRVRLSVVISETYPQLVRAGAIKQVQGVLSHVGSSATRDGATVFAKSHDDKEIKIDNVVGIVYATGFETAKSLSLLSEEVKNLIEYRPDCHQLPVVLEASYLSQNDQVPNLAVIGFASQYWTVAEMQARAVTDGWTSGTRLPQVDERRKIASYIRDFRRHIEAGNTDKLPPYPFMDYVGLTEQAARELKLEKVNQNWLDTEGPICAARYIDPSMSREVRAEAVKTMNSLQKTYREPSKAHHYASRTIYHSLLGTWTSVQGGPDTDHDDVSPRTVEFRPHLTADDEIDFEYMVTESDPSGTGTGTGSGSGSGSGTIQRIWRYEVDTEDIAIWSMSDSASTETCTQLCKLVVSHQSGSDQDSIVTAVRLGLDSTSAKWDVNLGEYRFSFKGAYMSRFEITQLDGRIETWLPVERKR